MISKKYIKELEFKTIVDVFNYVVDSEINGNYRQFKELINKFSKIQFVLFLKFIENSNYGNSEDTTIFKNKVLNARSF